ncbi:hypothetical protein [Pseudooceanicola sp. MF1-13]|uniref:hypothetical protein n=1 Tax=Pseudooceanicola sp. MF1-13 TaxID=3379095 RepID=UPI003891B2AE
MPLITNSARSLILGAVGLSLAACTTIEADGRVVTVENKTYPVGMQYDGFKEEKTGPYVQIQGEWHKCEGTCEATVVNVLGDPLFQDRQLNREAAAAADQTNNHDGGGSGH